MSGICDCTKTKIPKPTGIPPNLTPVKTLEAALQGVGATPVGKTVSPLVQEDEQVLFVPEIQPEINGKLHEEVEESDSCLENEQSEIEERSVSRIRAMSLGPIVKTPGLESEVTTCFEAGGLFKIAYTKPTDSSEEVFTFLKESELPPPPIGTTYSLQSWSYYCDSDKKEFSIHIKLNADVKVFSLEDEGVILSKEGNSTVIDVIIYPGQTIAVAELAIPIATEKDASNLYQEQFEARPLSFGYYVNRRTKSLIALREDMELLHHSLEKEDLSKEGAPPLTARRRHTLTKELERCDWRNLPFTEEAAIQMCLNHGLQYVDKNFSPCASNWYLGTANSEIEEENEAILSWIRPRNFVDRPLRPRIRLFESSTNAANADEVFLSFINAQKKSPSGPIMQHWKLFLSVIKCVVSLARNTVKIAVITANERNQDVSSIGAYRIGLHKPETLEPVMVVVDDYLPIFPSRVAKAAPRSVSSTHFAPPSEICSYFTTSNNLTLWPALLVKAIAKTLGSYWNCIGYQDETGQRVLHPRSVLVRQTLEILTGSKVNDVTSDLTPAVAKKAMANRETIVLLPTPHNKFKQSSSVATFAAPITAVDQSSFNYSFYKVSKLNVAKDVTEIADYSASWEETNNNFESIFSFKLKAF